MSGTHSHLILFCKRDVKTVSADTEGQKTSRTRKEGRRQRHKTESDAAQSTRSQKQEEKTNREAAETKKQSALPSEVSHLY